MKVIILMEFGGQLVFGDVPMPMWVSALKTAREG
jgi:hypothetical protein